jgi:hypothetical protein
MLIIAPYRLDASLHLPDTRQTSNARDATANTRVLLRPVSAPTYFFPACLWGCLNQDYGDYGIYMVSGRGKVLASCRSGMIEMAAPDSAARERGMSIYVEIPMRTDMEKLWKYTQTPELHSCWDLRFSSIEYLPRPDTAKPQSFLYSTRIGFGVVISGKGETVGEREDSRGCTTSALRFWSNDPRSLIFEGSGYWQYVPTSEGIRFLTQYNYQTRFGWIGRWFDRLVFRPLLGWATAWSFDRLRIWLERGIDPAASLERSVVHSLVRIVLAFIWIYQGVVPKLLFRDTGELAILRQAHLFTGHEDLVLSVVGIAEVLFGCLVIRLWHSRTILTLNILLLALLGGGALVSQPGIFVAPFNPLTLNIAVAGLAAIGLVVAHDLPSSRSCGRKRPEKES